MNCPFCGKENFLEFDLLKPKDDVITINTRCKYCMGPIQISYKMSPDIVNLKKGVFSYDTFGRPSSKSSEPTSYEPCKVCCEPFKNCSCKRKSGKLKYEIIEDIIVGAFEGGINYWLYFDERLNKDLDFLKGEPFSINITRNLYLGKDIILTDAEDHMSYGVLTLEKLEKAILDYGEDPEGMDVSDYDSIIQTAVFGEVVFG